MTKIILILLLMITFLVAVIAIGQDVQDAKDEHAGHDHAIAEKSASEPDEHEGHDHAAEDKDSNDQTAAEIIVTLSPEAQKMAGVTLSNVKLGYILKSSELPGEVGFNEDRLVHIAPRFAGIALEARCRVGSYVKAGDIVAIIESNESMNSYSITAPISGWIIDRHVTPGEYVSGESSIFVLADLSTVWVNLAVYPKDADLVKAGQDVFISAIGSDRQVAGVIDFVTPVLDVLTRSSTARVVLSNTNNSWKPGTFVHARVNTAQGDEGLIVEKEAVQQIGEETVIFVEERPNEFAAVSVVVGDSDDQHIRILEGLSEGVKYVAAGAFELKAKIVTSSLSGHAGHGH